VVEVVVLEGEEDDGDKGEGSSMVRVGGRRSGSKCEWEPMLRLVAPERRERAPGPTRKEEVGNCSESGEGLVVVGWWRGRRRAGAVA
jgi:hypothetical protein